MAKYDQYGPASHKSTASTIELGFVGWRKAPHTVQCRTSDNDASPDYT